MRKFTYRRIRNAGLLLLGVAGVWCWLRAVERGLGTSSFTSGYLLIGAVLFLALYNVRKKLPFLPLGSSAAWLQWHLYVGLGTVAVFGWHAGFAWPGGVLNASLATVYLLTVASGFVGLYLTRTVPAQLARVGAEIIYEQIPAFQRQVRGQAGEVVLESVAASGATTLADFYTARLYDFFGRPRGWGYFFWPTTARCRALVREMSDLRRYLSEQELAGLERLYALVRRKDDLDFHDARQRALKLWLFVHIALTCALVPLALLHGLLAHAFHGGVT
jgi:hypothetical protein